MTHGYSTLVDLFNYDTVPGLEFIAAPKTATMKSLGSNTATRTNVANCLSTHSFPAGFTTCNPDSLGASTTQAWDLTSWQQGGLLASWGWTGAVTGTGLNALGVAVGQASIVYQYMVSRVIGEICPLGSVSAASQAAIASEAQTGALAAADKDNFGYIVASIASDVSCR